MTERRVVVPTLREYVARECRVVNRKIKAPVDVEGVWLLGRVMSADGASVAGTSWRISRRAIAGAPWQTIIDGVTGADGFIPWCKGLPRDGEVRIEVWRGGPPLPIVLLLTEPVTVLPIPLPR